MSLTTISNKACDKAGIVNIANVANVVNVAIIATLSNKPCVHARVSLMLPMAPSMLRFKVSVISLMALMMSACQSPLSSTIGTQANDHTAPLVQQQTPSLAKTALANALKRQRHSDYAYHINALASNETYRRELATATPQQLAMSDNAYDHCRHMHDTGYINMLEQAEAANKEIDDEAFLGQRQTLKTAFLECQSLYDAWEMAQDDEATDQLGYYLNQDEALDESSMPVEDEAASEASLAAMVAESDDNEAAGQQAESLPHYDSSHTRLDKRRATLLNDYLLKPLTLTSQGVYRPLAGQLSIAPSLHYNIRNLQVIGQDYILVDAKEGAIYVWADTLAPMLSYYLDDKLGTQMHNKWLKLELNDGSLPDGFGRDVIASHFLAIDTLRANSTVNEYGFISAATLLDTDAKPHSLHIPYLVAPTIIERRQDKLSMAKDLKTYRQTLYQSLTDKYPELKMIEADADAANVEIDYRHDRDDRHVDAANSDVLDADTAVDNSVNTDIANKLPKSPPLNSLLVMQKLLALIKVDDGADAVLDTDTMATNDPVSAINGTDKDKIDALATAATDATKNDITPPIAPQHPTIDYAAYPAYVYAKNVDANSNSAAASSLWTLRDVYGLDNRQNIQWHLRQYQNPTDDMAATVKKDALGHLTYETLTRYSVIPPLSPMFATLPQDAAMPSADNTINFNTYSQDLMQRYKNGEGLERGKIILKTIKGIGGELIP